MSVVELFNTRKVLEAGTYILDSGRSISPLPKESTRRSLMNWENWNNGFKVVQIPRFTYENCSLIVCYFWYARRDDSSLLGLSQAQSLPKN